jgi:hypothetical protein
MSTVLIKTLGTITAIIVCGGIGGIGGIVMSYIISTSKPGFPFSYRLAIIIGIIGGIYGLVSSIREVWLR